MKKTTLALLTLSALLAAGFFVTGQVKAEDNDINYPPVVQRLIEKFNLDGDEVEEVFAEVRQERQTLDKNRFEERLGQLVSDGSLTEEQKQAILNKREQLRQESQNWQNLSVDERHKLMEEHRNQMQLWADQEGIDLSLTFGLEKKGGFHRQFGN
jgi:hypothetical protein